MLGTVDDYLDYIKSKNSAVEINKITSTRFPTSDKELVVGDFIFHRGDNKRIFYIEEIYSITTVRARDNVFLSVRNVLDPHDKTLYRLELMYAGSIQQRSKKLKEELKEIIDEIDYYEQTVENFKNA